MGRVGDPGGRGGADGFVVVVEGCPEGGEGVDVEGGWRGGGHGGMGDGRWEKVERATDAGG